MSIFGELFGEKKETKPKKVKTKTSKKKAKSVPKPASKKALEEKSTKKEEEKVQKLVFNSDREVEKYYREERERAKGFLKDVEKRKAASLLEVAKKQYNQIKVEKHNLDILMSDLVLHAKNIAEKVKEANSAKGKNIKNISLVKRLKASFYGLEREATSIVLVRKKLAEKEKLLLDRMGKIANESIGKLKLSDSENAERLLEIENTKQRLVNEAKTLLSQENYEMALDKKVLDNIGKMARRKIKNLNRKLKDLRKERVDSLKKRQLLEISEDKVKDKLLNAERGINKIKRKYRRVLGLKK